MHGSQDSHHLKPNDEKPFPHLWLAGLWSTSVTKEKKPQKRSDKRIIPEKA